MFRPSSHRLDRRWMRLAFVGLSLTIALNANPCIAFQSLSPRSGRTEHNTNNVMRGSDVLPSMRTVPTSNNNRQQKQTSALSLMDNGTAAAAAAVVDLSRVTMIFSAMSSYALIASLLLGSGLYLFAITPVRVGDLSKVTTGDYTKVQKRAIQLFTIVVSTSIATALHTSITFNVMTLYANTALGQGMDKQFLQFWNTPSIQSLRKTAFYSFLASMETFKLSFALSMFIKSDGWAGKTATFVASVIMVLSGVVFWRMAGVASKVIFS